MRTSAPLRILSAAACVLAIVAAAASVVRTQTIELQPATIQGTITGLGPIEFMFVSANWTSYSASTSVSNSPSYTLTVNVPTGSSPIYSVRPQSIRTDNGFDTLHLAPQNVAVAANQTATANFAVNPAFVSGTLTVTGGTMTSANISASGTGGWSASTTTNASRNGAFRFAIIPGATVNVFATVNFSNGTSASIPVRIFSDVIAGAELDVTATVAAPAANGGVQGTVTVTGPRAISARSVTVSGPVFRSTTPSALGQYAFLNLPDGNYNLWADVYFDQSRVLLRLPYGHALTDSPPFTIAGAPIVRDLSAEQAFIKGTFALTGTRTLADTNNGFVYVNGQFGTATTQGHGYHQFNRPSGDFELVVSPGTWLMNSYNYVSFFNGAPASYLNAFLQIFDNINAAAPIAVAAGETATRNLTYATGTVTVVLRSTTVPFSFPSLSGSCTDVVNGQTRTTSFINASGIQSNVLEAPVTFVGIKGRCNITASARANGSNGSTTFGSVIIDVVPGSDQTVDIGGPTLQVTSPQANTAFSAGPITVSGTADDDQQIASVKVNGITATLASTNNAPKPAEVSFSASVPLTAGANTIRTVATDAAGKETIDTRTVYLDNQAPTVTWTPAHGATFPPGDVVVAGTAFDNIGVRTVTVNGAVAFTAAATPPASAAFTKTLSFATGTHDIMVVVTDAGGRTVTETRRITVAPVDSTPPEISVPSPVTTEATDANGAHVSYGASATDAVDGNVPVSCTPASGGQFPLGTTTVTCTAKDAVGNQASKTFTITVRDTTAPAITNVPAPFALEATSPAGVPLSYPLPRATDAVSGPVAVTCSPMPGSTFPLGTTTVQCSASDAAGNTASASFAVNVSDTTAPMINGVPADISMEAASAAGAVVHYQAPTATDAVDPAVTAICSPASGATFPPGEVTVQCSATDKAGNTSAAHFTVTVSDTTAPSISGVPADITIEATNGDGTAVSYATPIATDAVDGNVAVSCSPASGATFPVGQVTVQCAATDGAGNSSAASFLVTVSDTTAPSISGVPANITVEATTGTGAAVSYATPTASDAVDGDVAVSCSPSSGGTFPLGEVTVQCSATDAAGNTSATHFTVTVSDRTAPTMSGSPADVVAEATSAAGAIVSYASPIATDAVDGNVAVSCSPASATVFPLGDTPVQCAARDRAGNVTSAGFAVRVRDTTAPVLSLPGRIDLVATSASGAQALFSVTAMDLVDGPVVPVCTAASGASFQIGTTDVRCEAVDAAGNRAAGRFVVSVGYNLCLLYDPAKVHNAGSTVPVRVQLCTAAGDNLSSASVTLNATAVVMLSTTAEGVIEDAGQANADSNFRYDAALGGTGGYIFNLQTKGLSRGTYEVRFTAGTSPSVVRAPFRLR